MTYRHLLLFWFLIHCELLRTKPKAESPDETHQDSIQLTLTHTGLNRVKMQCDARGVNVEDSLIMLSCPAVPTGVCQENCVHPCPIIQDSPACLPNISTPIKSCNPELISNNHMRIEYDIELDKQISVGYWRCMFRGKTSNAVYLDYQPPEVEEAEKNTESDKQKAVLPALRPSAMLGEETKKPEGLNKVYQADFGSKLPVETLILILAVLTISIVTNFLLCICCALVKRYMKKLHKGEPRDFCLDQLMCLEMSKSVSSPGRRYRAEYNRIPEPHSSYPGTGFSTVLEPSSPIFLQHHLRAPPQTFFPLSPLTVRNLFPLSPRPTPKFQPETVYDDVHNSVYTTLGSSTRMEQSKQTTTNLTSPDGRHWVLDPDSQFYFPYDGPTTMNPASTTNDQLPAQDRHSHRLPPPPPGEAIVYADQNEQNSPRAQPKPQNRTWNTVDPLQPVGQQSPRTVPLIQVMPTQFVRTTKPKVETVRRSLSDSSDTIVEPSEEAIYSFPDARFQSRVPVFNANRPLRTNSSLGRNQIFNSVAITNGQESLIEDETAISNYDFFPETQKLMQVPSIVYLEDWTISESTEPT